MYTTNFSTLSEKTSHKPLKAVAAKTSFPGVYIIDTTCFDECFLLHVITRGHYFLYKCIATQRFDTTAMFLSSLEQVFGKKPAFYSHYLHNDNIMPLIPTVQNIASTS